MKPINKQTNITKNFESRCTSHVLRWIIGETIMPTVFGHAVEYKLARRISFQPSSRTSKKEVLKLLVPFFCIGNCSQRQRIVNSDKEVRGDANKFLCTTDKRSEQERKCFD